MSPQHCPHAPPHCLCPLDCIPPLPSPPHTHTVFRDADDEYGSLTAVKRRLEEWKARQPGAYADAYVSLSAPALFAPFVRLELLKWRPLHGGDAGGWVAPEAQQRAGLRAAEISTARGSCAPLPAHA